VSLPLRSQSDANGNYNYNHNHNHNHNQTATATPRADTHGASAPDGDEAAARALTIAANRAIAERWGEQTRPLRASHVGAMRLVEALRSARVPIAWAQQQLSEVVRTLPLNEAPRSAEYFRFSLVALYERAVQQGATTKVADDGMDSMQRLAIIGAANGDAEWQAYCTEHGWSWESQP
jgi:hypothetical protein